MNNFLITGSDYLAKHPNFKLVGRNHELERLSAILMRNSANSVLLAGAGGVGITALALGLQARKADPDAPFDIVAKRLFWLDTDGLFASGDTNEINKSFQKIMEILKRTPDSILLIEDTRDFIDGARNNGVGHFINALTSSIKNGYTQAILEVRDDDLDLVVKAHSDLRECFTLMDLGEPSGTELAEITSKNAETLFQHHGIRIDDVAVATAIELTNKYRTRDPGLSRAQPERSATLLDRALSSYRLTAHKNVAPELTEKLRKLYKNQREGEIAVIELEEFIETSLAEAESKPKEEGGFTFKSLEPESVTEARKKIKQYQALIDENRAEFDEMTAKINADLVLTKELVMAEFAKISGISASKLGEDEREKLKSLEPTLKNRIFGQDEAVTKLANAVKTARVVRRNKDQPQAAFMFLGPSGVGKTEIAKALSEALLDDEKALSRFDMSEYGEKHAVAKLIGAPPGYDGFGEGGILTNLMRKNPNQIILFDEIEKADASIYNIFLSILSDSRLTDNLGRTVSFNDAILIFTTNIGQPHFLNKDLDFPAAQELAIQDLNATYRSEFLNRFAGRQNIVCFNKLDVSHIEKIVTREIKKLGTSYIDAGLSIVVSDDVVTSFCADHYDPVIGARGLPGYITANLEPIFADMVLNGFTGAVNVSYNNETKSFEVN